MAKAHEQEDEAIRQIVEVFQKLPTCEKYMLIGYAQSELVHSKERVCNGTCSKGL